MEWWNTGRLVFKGYGSFLIFMVNKNSTINSTLHYSKTHYSIIPLFQHSNEGEASILFNRGMNLWLALGNGY